jgi:hypothetical protein
MHKPRRAIVGVFFYISNTPTGFLACLWEIVENNIPKLAKRDIKPLQIVVLSRF